MRVRIAEPVLAITLLVASTAASARAIRFDIPAGALGQALIVLGEQAHITIGVTDPRIAAIRSPGVHGRMELRQALAKLLSSTGYTFILAGGSVRIVPAAPSRADRSPARSRPPARPAADAAEIVITASKQDVRETQFGGTIHLIELSRSDLSRLGAHGSDAILDQLPVLASTHLGPGRDKLYVRGVADSSFNGPSQSIVGLYLGDTRMTFNAPDPGLALYDMNRVELLEGPQGTLYGTGSLGGILKFVPNRPEFDAPAGFVSAGGVATAHGGVGGDASATLNLPLASNVALRAVGYATSNPGYIDDLRLDRRDINRTNVRGGRAALRIDAGNNWDIEISGVAQNTDGRDGQYALSTLPPLKRESNFAQPYDNDYRLASFTVRRKLPEAEFVSATGWVRHDLEARFDATGFPDTIGPQLFVEDIEITMISNETRVSRLNARGEGWLAGLGIIHDVDQVSRKLGPIDALAPLSRLRNELTEVALFGQYSYPLTEGLLLTAGGRVTYNREEGGLLDADTDAAEPKRESLRFSPSAAMTYQLGPKSVAYVRFAQAHRAGGVAVSDGGSVGSVRRFETDSLSSIEAGVRLGHLSRDRLAFSASVSHARWKDVQADLIDPDGLPFTTNLGNGRIDGFEVEAAWRPVRGLTFELAAFVNESTIHSSDGLSGSVKGDLPNIAGAGARGSVQFKRQLSSTVSFEGTASLRYVGKSRLGITPPLDLKQGGYAEGDIGARLELGRFGVSLGVTNVADVRGNRFSLGNPFSVTQGNQITPLRPRTLRLAIDAAF
jgi:outer membrane receptor protein involved in Fe transport